MGAALAIGAVLALARGGFRSSASSMPQACLGSVALGYNHACGLYGDGSVWCWGKVGFDRPFDAGRESAGREPEMRTVPLQIRDADGRPLLKIAELTSRYTTSCARELQGTVWCWGTPTKGRLGDGRVEVGLRTAIASPVKDRPNATGQLARIARVAPGSDHTCAVEENGKMHCWGDNQRGQLGLGETNREPQTRPRPLPQGGAAFSRIASGAFHTCATRTDGTLWCWGDNRSGQLGTMDAHRESPRPLLVRRADGAPFTDVLDMGLGDQHSCVVTKAGELLCWGGNRFGELGRDTPTSSPAPQPVLAAPDDRPLTSVVAVRSGDHFTCALRNDGTVWCFGDNAFGQLGAGSSVEASSRAVAVLTAPSGPRLNGVVQIAAGSFSACALRGDGSLWCWGRNHGMQLGVGDTRDRNVAVQARPPCR